MFLAKYQYFGKFVLRNSTAMQTSCRRHDVTLLCIRSLVLLAFLNVIQRNVLFVSIKVQQSFETCFPECMSGLAHLWDVFTISNKFCHSFLWQEGGEVSLQWFQKTGHSALQLSLGKLTFWAYLSYQEKHFQPGDLKSMRNYLNHTECYETIASYVLCNLQQETMINPPYSDHFSYLKNWSLSKCVIVRGCQNY